MAQHQLDIFKEVIYPVDPGDHDNLPTKDAVNIYKSIGAYAEWSEKRDPWNVTI